MSSQFYTITSPYFGRNFLLISNGNSIIAIRMAKNEEDAAFQLAKFYPHAKENTKNTILKEAVQQLQAFSNGTRQNFTFPVEDNGSPFHRKVREVMATIPYGKTVSYSELAEMAGNAKAFRAAASACASNELAIYYPCHRVLHKDGNISGYAYGLDVKKALLDHEANNSAKKAAA